MMKRSFHIQLSQSNSIGNGNEILIPLGMEIKKFYVNENEILFYTDQILFLNLVVYDIAEKVASQMV